MPKKTLEIPFEAASRLYLEQKIAYERALAAISAIADAETKAWAKKAITSHVRGKFGGIGRTLTKNIGCHLCALPKENTVQVEIEHAIPLNLIHNEILGITYFGAAAEGWTDNYSTREEIEAFLRKFVIGVRVTHDQHLMLKKKDMPGGWNWLVEHPDWSWDTISGDNWDYACRPTWLKAFMARYENVAATNLPFEYRPLN